MDLSIKPLQSNSKDKVVQPKLAQMGIIPELLTSSLFVAKSGGGKTTLLLRLLTDDRFYGGRKSFDEVLLISPSADGCDLQKELAEILEIKESHIITNMDDAVEALEIVMDKAKEDVAKLGPVLAPKWLLIFDDCITHNAFQKSNAYLRSFVASRHINATVMACTQSYKKVERAARLSANNIFFFGNSASYSELECIAEEYGPPSVKKNEFIEIIREVTKEPYSFLYINNKCHPDKRYRQNLSHVIKIKTT